MPEKQIIALETKMSYVEDYISKLQETILEQNRRIEKLQEENKSMRSKLTEIINSLEDIPNIRPPHY